MLPATCLSFRWPGLSPCTLHNLFISIHVYSFYWIHIYAYLCNSMDIYSILFISKYSLFSRLGFRINFPDRCSFCARHSVWIFAGCLGMAAGYKKNLISIMKVIPTSTLTGPRYSKMDWIRFSCVTMSSALHNSGMFVRTELKYDEHKTCQVSFGEVSPNVSAL